MEELLIGLGLWYLFRRKKDEEVIKNDEYTPSTGTRKPGSGDATDPGFDYTTTLEEIKTDPWTWASRPAIFKEVPLSPGSRKRWLELGRLWVDLKENEINLYGALRDAYRDDQERGGTTDTQAIIKQYRQNGYMIMAAIRRIVGIQRKQEGKYRNFLKRTYGNATTSQYYAERKQQILSGIWPRTETTVVPVNVVSPGDVKTDLDRVPTDPGTGVVQMGSPTDRSTWAYPNVERKHYQTKVPVRKRYNQRASEQDLRLKAKPPGKRISKSGNVYYERRVNRSDYVRKNADGSNWYM